MRRMRKTLDIRNMAVVLLLWMLSLSSGCGGYYIMTVPDQLARVGGDVVPVGRLQRNDFFFFAFGCEGGAMRFQLVNNGKLVGQEEVSFTDRDGYAAVALPVSKKTGIYAVCVTVQDSVQGEEVRQVVPLFVWDPDRPVVAVDINALPRGALDESDPAAVALRKIAKTANIIYLTRKGKPTQKAEHDRLEGGNYPAGPILLWQRERWRWERKPGNTFARIVIESRMESQLPKLRDEFPNLTVGICKKSLAVKAFVAAGMKCVVIGNNSVTGSTITNHETWGVLAKKGL
ncbi:MAG: hypothetical protein KAR11_08905 [Phycisphaerae bacterium]|nr:hypothetical protein [Phycisphaerae bacterium]